MDLNEMAKAYLAILERQAVALEAIASKMTAGTVTNIVLPEGSEVKKVGDVLKSTVNKESDETVTRSLTADEKAAVAELKKQAAVKKQDEAKTAAANVEQAEASETSSSTDASASEEKTADTQPQASQEEKSTKPLSADDVRKALKAFAAIEGNAAAMELLSSFGASSVSELLGLGQETVVAFVQKCEA